MSDDEVPVRYVMERFGELQQSLAVLGQRIEDRLGEAAVRLARLEMRADQTDKRLDDSTVGRRWSVGTWLAGISALLALVAVIVAIVVAVNTLKALPPRP